MSDSVRPFLIAVVGPTGTGKTALAIRLAEEMDGEIVSADSVQVYRHFNIGSAKPSPQEIARVPHHLLDLRDPLDPLEAKQWASYAEEKIVELQSRGKVPILCGGTYLWVRALIFGLAEAPAGEEEIRQRHRKIALEKGRPFLHRALAEVDPVSAERLHENDLLRVSRALEVFELSGKTLSEIQAAHGFREPRYRVALLALEWDRDVYEERLIARVKEMLAAGWQEEVKGLLVQGYGDARAMAAVGYRQVKQAVEAESRGEVVSSEGLLEDIVRVTRIFARRQRTWLRDEQVRAIPSSVVEDAARMAELASSLKLEAQSA